MTAFFKSLTSTALLGSVVLLASSNLKPATAHAWFSSNAKQPYRPNRVYFPIRYEAEFEPLLLLKTPLLANFTYRGDPKSDKLTGVLNRIVSEETDYRISAVDIEADEPTTRDLLLRYSVTELPTIVAIRGGIPYATFTLPAEFTKDSEIDWQQLKAWIESVADKPI